jgi:ABC-type sugar transport system ATPase subunit
MNSCDAIPAVSFRGIGKRFPGTVALKDVSFEIQAGSCHAIMGENGAGKSTLGKVLAGLCRPDEGSVGIEGRVHHLNSPWEAQRAGVGIVHQELSFCPNLTVAENICLSDLPHRRGAIDWRRLREKAQQYLDEIGAVSEVDHELGSLTTGQAQLVQIAASLATGARIFVMDEPTSSLSTEESQRLYELIQRLRSKGATIIYISHRTDEIFRLCDTVTVMRDGEHIATLPLSETNENELIQLMIGRPWQIFPPHHLERVLGPERLRVEGLSSLGKFRDINFTLCAGEIVGMAGLVGAGRSEVAMAIFGLDAQSTGKIFIEDQEVSIRNPREAMNYGIGLVSEDRKGHGFIPEMGCDQNITLCSLHKVAPQGIIRHRKENHFVVDFMSKLRVKATSASTPVKLLSGGNQQKVVLAKWLARQCRILILDEPTRGVDVGAKAEIHQLIDDLAADGYAILMISSELPEVLNLSSRVMVMRNGRMAGILNRREATQESIMQLMAGNNIDAPQVSPVCKDQGSAYSRLN